MIITFGTSTSPIDPGSIEDVIEQLKRDVNAKVSAGTLNAALTSVRTDMELGDEMNKVLITEIEPEEAAFKSYRFTQGNEVLGTISLPEDIFIQSGDVVEIEGVTYLRLFIKGVEDPILIDVSKLIELEDYWSTSEIDEIFG